MDSETKLLLALYQVEGVMKLTEDNEYKVYLHKNLNTVYYELTRQLKNLKHQKQ